LATDLPSDEAYEKESPLPEQKPKLLKPNTTFDFFDPKEQSSRDVLKKYLAEAEQLKLSKDRHWENLLRYQKNVFNNFTSEIETESYFLSEKGKVSPKKELDATIRALFYENAEFPDLSPQCTFPERYRWLRETLKIEPSYQNIRCPRFENWKQKLNPYRIKIIFASYYLESPASLFGHVFLKIDNSKNEGSELLDYGIGYAAEPGDIDPFRYIIGGIFGGYTGKFSIFPYYAKVNEYNHLENRDLWEYTLELDVNEMEILIGHLWEMGNADFDYYFHRENCAYQILRLMEVTKQKDFGIKSQYFVTPLDSIRVLLHHDVVKEAKIQYRASQYNLIKNKLLEMSDLEREQFFLLLNDIDSGNELSTQPEIKSNLVESLLLAFQYRMTENKASRSDGRYLNLLKLQSSLPNNTKETTEVRVPDSPDKTHGSSRISLGYGNSNLGNFYEWESRLVFHDLLNQSKGLVPTSEIQFFNFKIRNYENNRTELTTFNLIKLASFSPYNNLTKKYSYYIDIGSQTLSYQNLEKRKAVGNLDLLYGYSFAKGFNKEVYLGNFSILGGLKTHSNADFASGMRYGPQIMFQYMYEWNQLKLQWLYSYSYFAMSRNENFFQNTLRLRYAIHDNHELRVEFTAFPQYQESSLAYHFLF